MNKLVILELDGDFERQGFRVTLEILSEEISPDSYSSRQPIKIKGHLPANAELATHLNLHWRETYRALGAPSRIKTKAIIHRGLLDARVEKCKESAKELSDRFNHWLKSEEFRKIDSLLREELNRDDPIRFLIRTEDSHVQKLPWHKWNFFDRYPRSEVAFSPLESKPAKKHTLSYPAKRFIKILAILGHKEGIDIDADLEIIKKLPNIDLVFMVEPDRKQITEKLWNQPWDIIFFAGHSETIEETGRIYINPTDSLTLQELWYGLRKAVERGLKLAIFNSCDGLGLAKQLDDLEIPQMIVMRELVPDKVAQEFLKHFLAAFAWGDSLYMAVREARHRLHDDCDREFPCASWLPVICQYPTEIPPTWNQLLGKTDRERASILEVNQPQPAAQRTIEPVRLCQLIGQRALGTIVFTDVVSLSARMAADEERILRAIARDLSIVSDLCQQFEGRVFKSTGDGLLMYFSSALKAVACAIEIQKTLFKNAASLSPEDTLVHRIGIHVGEVFLSENDVMGNGVNIAARLESKAEPGGILMSEVVYEIVKNSLSVQATYCGEPQLKNISKPISAYQILPEEIGDRPLLQQFKNKLRVFRKTRKHPATILTGIVLSSAIATFGVMGIRHLGILQTSELLALDRLMRLRLAETPDTRLLVVAIAEEDFQLPEQQDRKGSLSDLALAKLIKKLEQYQPRAIGLDIYRDFSVEPNQPELANYLRQSDRFFAICHVSEPKLNNPGVSPPPELPRERIGFNDLVRDADGVIRRHAIAMEPNPTSPCTAVNALSTHLAFRYLRDEGISGRYNENKQLQIGDVIFPRLQAPMGGYQKIDDRGYQILLNYRSLHSPTNTIPTVTLTDVLTDKINPEAIENRVILIGVTGKSVSDYWPTPYRGQYEFKEEVPGIVIHAQMVSQILSAVLDDRSLLSAWPQWIDAVWVWGWSVLGGIIAWRVRDRLRFGIAAAIALGTLYGISLWLLARGLWIPLVPTTLAFLLTGSTLVVTIALLQSVFRR